MKLHKLASVLSIVFSLALASCGGAGGGSTAPTGVLPGVPAAPVTQPSTTSSTSMQTTTYSTTIMGDGPTAYYHLDDTSSTAADSSGNGLNGAIGSSVSKSVAGLVASTSDTAAGTPGLKSAAGVVKVPQNSKLQPSSAVSLEALLRFSSTPANYTVPVDYGQRSGIAPYGWYFSGGKIIAQFTLSSGVIDIGTPVLASNTTYDIVSTFDGSTGRLYVNGALVGSVSKSGTLADYVSGYGLTIGDSGALGDPAFKGTIDEVAVYAGKALSATQVANHYKAATSLSASSPAPAPTATTAPTASPAPTLAPTVAPTIAPTVAPTASAAPVSSVHYFDTTGCQDFPASDYWNRRVDTASVSSNSSTEIAWASQQSGSSGAPNFNGHYNYEVVPASQTEYKISSTSGHIIPDNYEAPAQSGWPVPSDMANLLTTADHVSVLIQQTSPPLDCRGWDGYAFSGSGTSWKAYSGDHVEMNQNMPPETCNGVAALCGEDLEGDLTYYELNANSGNSAGTVTRPILHAIHTEWPCADAGTCGSAPASAFNKSFNCQTSCARLRLKASAIPRPSDPNAAAVYDAMVHYGLDTSENGCCWGFYTIKKADDSSYPSSIPTAVSSFISTLRVTDFEVLANGSW